MSDKKRVRSRTETKAQFDNLNIPQSLSDKEKELRAQADEAIRSSISDLAIEKASQAITTANLANQKALSTVTEELTSSLTILGNVKANIALEAAELERLHGVRLISEHLDVVRAEHDEQVEELQKSIVEQRERWEQEKLLHTRATAEANAEQEKTRRREHDEYVYQTNQQRKLATDSFNEAIRTKMLEEQKRQRDLNDTWEAREKELATHEVELISLRAAVAAHQEELNKAVSKAVAIETHRLTKDHSHEKAFLEQDKKNILALHESEKASLNSALTASKKLVEDLTASLASAHAKNAEIATKALEASSGSAALAAVQNFAKDQGANGPAKRS